ncbi:hypothetical protein GFM11_33520 [Rhizobium leguminosarum bv. viciae]|uniref:hypothetical protein n=1 Tax=Rhizobium leguminosarum TaxID=384 RepID=UPI001442522B|nr:hypothetical protein [Rhizobium leguminosarum]NKK18077.1 hypothetical protein [Rhizobium leguminosarum bv. viciae]
MTTLEQFELKHDPFPIVPDGPVFNWAGREDLKDDLIDLVKGVRARDIGVTEFVVLFGELGAGKSHALRFLTTLIDSESSKEDGDFKSLALYVERPRVATKLNFLELHKYIIRILGRDRIKVYCGQVKEKFDAILNELATEAGYANVKDKSSFFESAVGKIVPNDRAMVRLLMRGAGDDAKIFEFLIGNEKCDGNEYEGKIDSDFMAAKILSDFFRVLTSELRPKERIVESVYLFIDECEVLVDAKISESDLVFSGFRELINELPYRFGMVLSFSVATALIEAIMPNHLLKRMTRNYVEVPMLDDDDAVRFLLDQINFHRPVGSAKAGTFYPFTEEAVRFIVENTNPVTPRNLFMDCKRVLERSIRRYSLQPGDLIERDVAEKILQGIR